jgi:hypothetical protein
MGKLLSIFSGPKIRIPDAPPAPAAPAPPAAEAANVDAPDPNALSNVRQRAASAETLVGRRKLRIPLISASTSGSGLSIPM